MGVTRDGRINRNGTVGHRRVTRGLPVPITTTVGLSVPILPRLLHKHLLLRVTRLGQPCFLIRSRTATTTSKQTAL